LKIPTSENCNTDIRRSQGPVVLKIGIFLCETLMKIL
jgi:hypothetical protein